MNKNKEIGWVYVITNPAMPHLVKIGFTTKTPEERARELKATGVPYSHEVRYKMRCYDFAEIEKQAHALLAAQRADKEWFECSVETAIAAIRQVAGKNKIDDEIVRLSSSHSHSHSNHNHNNNFNPNNPSNYNPPKKSSKLPFLNKVIVLLLFLIAMVIGMIFLVIHQKQSNQAQYQLNQTWNTIPPEIQSILAEEQQEWAEKTDKICKKHKTPDICQENAIKKRIQYLNGYIIKK